MEQDILNQIEDYHNKTNGKCGLPLTQIKGRLSEVKAKLNELYSEGKIIVREGVNQKLIFSSKLKEER